MNVLPLAFVSGVASAADVLPAILMIAVFLMMTGLMYARRISALLALPIMAFLFALVGLVRVIDFFSLIEKAAGPELEARMRWSMAGFLLLWAGVYWARRRKLIPPLGGWIVLIVGVFVALIANMSAIAWLSVRGEWGALFQCLELKTIVDEVVHKGAVKLFDAYTVAFFGGMLAIYVKEKKLAEIVIKYAAELAGDKPMAVAMIMMLVIAALFTTLGGLGAIIMVGSIVLPIMLSLGLSARVAAGIFLIGLCAGGTFNPGGWALYTTALKAPIEDIQKFALIIIGLYLITGTLIVGLSLKGSRRSRRWTWAATGGASTEEEAADRKHMRFRPVALLSPVIPIFLVFKLSTFAGLFSNFERRPMFFGLLTLVLLGLGGFLLLRFALYWFRRRDPSQKFSPPWISAGFGIVMLGAYALLLYAAGDSIGDLHAKFIHVTHGFTAFAKFWDTYIGGWQFIPAFIVGLLFCMATTWDTRGGNIRVLTKSIIEGAESVMPAVILMCGIGMLLQVVMNPQVGGYLKPLIAAVTPSTKLWYVVGFGLAAPLALYRGPLNVWGLGLGIAGVMMATGKLSSALLVGMFMSVGAVQGVCDPTNTHNVWIANFLGEDVLAVTRFLLPFIWLMVFVGLGAAVLLFPL